MPPKILLLQVRNPGDPVRSEERQSFAHKARLDLDYITPWDLLTGPPSMPEVKKHDALMVGGSGDYYVSKQNLPHFPAVMALLQDVVAHNHPTFASCFGFQLLVKALGGEIIYDAEQMEVGTYLLTLTPQGQRDEVLGTLPIRFKAQLGRKDRATIIPKESIHLASSGRCLFQAIRWPGQPIWATQFHPELSGEENRFRFKRYLNGYASVMSDEERKKALERFTDSPETETLMARFLKVVFDYEPAAMPSPAV